MFTGRIGTILLAAAVVALAPQAARADKLALRADAAASTLTFTLGATAHTVHGTFRIKEAEVLVDTADGSASGKIVVDATSGATGNSSRDRKMHATVLRSATFPEIVFAPARVTGHVGGNGASDVQIAGSFTLLGRVHEVTIPLHVVIDGARAAVSGSFAIPYVLWGLEDPSVFILRVDKSVQLEIRLAGSLQRHG